MNRLEIQVGNIKPESRWYGVVAIFRNSSKEKMDPRLRALISAQVDDV